MPSAGQGKDHGYLVGAMRAAAVNRGTDFLSIPPFPHARVRDFAWATEPLALVKDEEADRLLAMLSNARVGGSTWGPQPDLPPRYRLVQSDRLQPWTDGTIVWWTGPSEIPSLQRSGIRIVAAECDPWHLLKGADELACDSEAIEARLIAGLSGVPVRLLDRHDSAPALLQKAELRALLRRLFAGGTLVDPFTGKPVTLSAAIELCGFWRGLIDRNREFAGAFGFARWKRPTTAPLLWGGRDVAFDPPPSSIRRGDAVALWRSRISPSRLAKLERYGAVEVEIEDGFIRSAGLGADCVPPQSILVDWLGIHFDASRPSDLEQLLERVEVSAGLLARAESLRARIVTTGLSKYDVGYDALDRRSPARHILVPGQVEDDRAVLEALGGVLTNRALLARVRKQAPDAYLIYKPHPDVEAGHRRGALPDTDALAYADEIVRDRSISSWIDLSDEVHVNSSLAGFEALMRGKNVTTYGVPFYAGWGLTHDRGPVPHRRTRRRSLGELVAICLLLYPRYVDPHTNLPCPLEVLIDRLLDPTVPSRPGALVAARRAQGWLKQLRRKLVRSRT